ncbi:MAG: sce7725 family protein [Thermotogaceae bacterium]|nr:sce7725 family protein [Thermotogaceae bacterium]
MYFPYLRGRQYELLAIGELIDNNLLNDHVIPVVEPVKLSFTLIHVMEKFIKAKHPIAIISNPAVGNFFLDWKDIGEESKQRRGEHETIQA